MTALDRNSYNLVPYDSYPFPETHPAHLEAIGKVFGICPADPQTSRILEVGCSSGHNLFPIAFAYPESQVIGFDLSSQEIKLGDQFLEQFPLGNVKLFECDVCDWASGEVCDLQNKFDYIIVHGVLSWVPEIAQKAIFSLFSNCLAPEGIVYVSYNTYPGWHSRAFLRDLLRFHTAQHESAPQKISESKRLMKVFAQALQGKDYPLIQHTREMLRSASGLPDWYLFHDLLEENNTPFYLVDVVEIAESFGLQYLGDADPSVMVDFDLPEKVQTFIREKSGTDLPTFEQYLDFFANRMLRRSLFVRKEISIDRSRSLEILRGMHLALPYTGAAPPQLLDNGGIALLTPRGLLETDDPVLAQAFLLLAKAWPSTKPCSDLLKEAQSVKAKQLGKTKAGLIENELNLLVNLFRAAMKCFVRLRTTPIKAGGSASEHPRVSSLAQTESKLLGRLTTCWHEHLDLNQQEQSLVELLDGSLPIAELVKRVPLETPSTEPSSESEVSRLIAHLNRRGALT